MPSAPLPPVAAPDIGARVVAARVVGVGVAVVDHLLTVPRLPEADRKASALAARVQTGGPVPTALAQLAKLGGPGGTLLSAWGDDADGRTIEADLTAAGLRFDPSACRTAPRTGFAQVWVEYGTGRRSLVAVRPDGGGLVAAAAVTAVTGCDLLHTDGWPGAAAVAAARAVRAAGGTVCVDLGTSEKPAALLELADVLNLPVQAAVRLTGSRDPAAAARTLSDRGPRLVTVTNGSAGCWFAARTDGGAESGFVPAFPANAADTCGAGDAFCGGLLFGTLAGFGAARAVRFAAAVASLKVRRMGNREALPDRPAVEALLATGGAGHEKTPAAP